MPIWRHRLLVLGTLLVACPFWSTVAAADDALQITPDRPNHEYHLSEKITWTITGTVPEIRYRLLRGEVTELANGTLTLVDGKASFTADAGSSPCTLLLEATPIAVEPSTAPATTKPATPRTLSGVVIARDQIALSAPPPADFDAFWEKHISELNAVPMDPQLEEVQPATQPQGKDAPAIQRWKITLGNIRGTHIRGQLARPVAGDKLPALLIVQWAGVYALNPDWVTSRATSGWLVLNINPHDLPIDEPAEFYQNQSAGPLKEYWSIGNDDPEQSYFLRMYLSCYRAADYLASRQDWDGRTLVVMGASQGGMQSLVTAGMHPKISGALALVPAGCDMLGPDLKRKPGWPQWINHHRGKDADKVREASRYYDVANFVTRIKCPVLVSAGLIDEVCPPEGIFAAFNQIKSKKELLLLPASDHFGTGGTQQPYFDRSERDWLPALKEGHTPP